MAKGRYKLLALDMDGTLLTEDKRISPENKAAIREAEDKGITVMFSTGRGIQNVQPYMLELKSNAPMVTVNGSEVWRAPDQLLERHTLKLDDVKRLRELALHYDTWYWAYSVEGIYNKEKWLSPEEASAMDWLKFGYYTENMESLTAIRREIEGWQALELTNSHPCNLELNPQGVSKASGLEKVCGLLDITMREVVAMGDSLNDVTMLRAAGLGVAMGNAQDEVKEIADLVTVTNEEHGVARIIREYLL